MAIAPLALFDLTHPPERLPDGSEYEVDEGEIIRLSYANPRHGQLVIQIGAYLKTNLSKQEFYVVADVGFVLSDAPYTLRAPDVAVLPISSGLPGSVYHVAPLLAVEIISPSNDALDIEKKRIQYLAAGSKEVWLVYPETRTMHVFQRSAGGFLVAGDDSQFESTIGGLMINVKSLFE